MSRDSVKLLCGFLLTLLGTICTSIHSSPLPDQKAIRDLTQDRYGIEGVSRLSLWLELMRNSANLSEIEQIHQVNNFFNLHIRHQHDIDERQERDYWATPLETLGVGSANCEDYAIAKYITLVQLGVPVERLRLIYVRAQIGGPNSEQFTSHLVLGYYSSSLSMPLVLDNLSSIIQPATERSDLLPLFSFSGDSLATEQNEPARSDSTAYLSPWRDLLSRIKHEVLRE